MRVATAILFLLFFGGCADKNAVNTPSDDFEDEFEAEFGASSEFDPLNGYNRAMTKFNDAAYRYALIPAAEGYVKIVPSGARGSINNFFNNLVFPVRFTNNLLQGEPVNAFGEIGRFIINTTVGFLGFADVAGEIYGIEEHDEDFGQTLGVWGVPSGPHIVLPLLGPTNIRDFGGGMADSLINPLSYYGWRDEINIFDNSWQSVSANTFRTLNNMADFAPMYETMTKDAIDLYPFLKNMYEQRRDKLIKE
ncbi:MAG: VacJ family lipoprotein [Campylobacteraceae bacterium]|jgi:phospholipid-binding lipoprotein MlaA|nr:VacJ family lipoprotein [Campylobacteraceae bacterium]